MAQRRAACAQPGYERATGHPVNEAALAVRDRAIFAASGGCGLNAKGFVSAMTGCATQPHSRAAELS